jgi:hypothetical protein
MKLEILARSLGPLLLLLANAFLAGPAWAMPGFDADVASLCARNGRAIPVFTNVVCTTCHSVENPTDSGGSDTLLEGTGRVYQAYLAAFTSEAAQAEVIDAFCKGVRYNLRYSDSEKLNYGSLPPDWNQPPQSFDYSGKLEVYWLAHLGSDRQRLALSRQDAASHSFGLPANFNLLALPNNCWGEKMNFGLLTLDRKANLTIRMAADASQGSTVVPGFALYKGWDSGPSSERHVTIVFGEDNPLGSEGLTFIGDALAGAEGDVAERTFPGLEPGNYEVFVTVGSNQSSMGAYTLELSTAPAIPFLTVNKAGNGAVASVPPGIDCGAACAAGYEPGTTVTLTATPDPGYRFKGWTGCPAVSGQACAVVVDQSLAIAAVFEPITYTVTVKTSGTGKVFSGSEISCGTGTLGLCSARYPQGASVTLFRQGALAGWGGACSGTGPSCALTLVGDVCVAANFAGGEPVACEGGGTPTPRDTLKVAIAGPGAVSSDVGGIACGAACAATLDRGTAVALTATPAQGYAFKRWSGACSGTAPACAVLLDGDKSVKAHFVALVPVAPACGSANNALASAAPSAPAELCQAGQATAPASLPDGRFAWSCMGVGVADAKCFTLSGNGKLNQPPLVLVPGDATLSRGGTLVQTVTGGAGKGKLRVVKSASPGTRCKVARRGLELSVQVGGAPGTCSLVAVKDMDRRYNAVESAAALITVVP